MARTKKVEQEPQESVLPVPNVPNDVPQPEPQDDGLVLPPDGKLYPIECDLEGFEHITVYFKTSNAWRLMNEPDAIPNEDGFGLVRKLMLIARRFEGWNFKDEFTGKPVPVPTKGDLESYKLLLRINSDYSPLGIWCLNDGYTKALNEGFGLKN